jgi:VanZ family protein
MAYAMLALVALLSLLPSPPDMGGNDKVLHFLTYFALSAGFTTLVNPNYKLLWVATGLILYGILIEFLQGLTGYRYLEIADMLANSSGVFCGLLLRLTAVPVWFRRLEMRFF